MHSIVRFFLSPLQSWRKEIIRALILLSYLVVLFLMALAYWPVLKLLLFMGIFFGLLLTIIIVFRLMQD